MTERRDITLTSASNRSDPRIKRRLIKERGQLVREGYTICIFYLEFKVKSIKVEPL